MALTDAELFRALCAAGPEREVAISQLRELLVRGVSKSLSGRYGKPLSPEDIAQDALIRILDSLGQYHGRSKFTTWSMTIAIRIGMSDLRRKYHADQSLDVFSHEDNGHFELASGEESSPEAAQSKQELLRVFQDLIDHQLTPKQRIVIRAYLSNYSSDGMAEALGMNRNAVYKLLHDARIRLKDGLEAAGYSADDVLSLLAAEEAAS